MSALRRLLLRRAFYYLMPAALVIILFTLFLAACAPAPEVIRPSPPPVAAAPVVKHPEPPPPPPEKWEDFLACDDLTATSYNPTGIDVLPFMRVAFADFYGSGSEEMAAGSRDGTVRLYRQGPRPGTWLEDANYFAGVRVSAFSAPAAADVDGDGRVELAVGTGGFSSDSGKVILYRNTGTPAASMWTKMDVGDIDIGDDATPCFADIDADRKPDLIIGNSIGHLVLYRNVSSGKRIAFIKDASFFKGIDLGMYAVPAAVVSSGRIVVIAANSMGEIYLLEKNAGPSGMWVKTHLKMPVMLFAAPCLVKRKDSPVYDMAIADSSGTLRMFRNGGDYRKWDEAGGFTSERIAAGSALAPSYCTLSEGPAMVLGNSSGELRFYSYAEGGGGLLWKEKPGFFHGVKLSSFSHGSLLPQEDGYLLVTGQQDGLVRAFRGSGDPARPRWTEQKNFFRGLPKVPHAAPVMFDLDEDGTMELIVGGVDGFVKGFRVRTTDNGQPGWEQIPALFDYVKVSRYAVPTLYREGKKIFLFVGDQEGGMSTFSYEPGGAGYPFFYQDAWFRGISVRNHCAPTVLMRGNSVEFSVGDYDGNLRHLVCKKDRRRLMAN